MNNRIKNALLYYRIKNGTKAELSDFGAFVFPDVPAGLAKTRAKNIVHHRKYTFKEIELERIAEFCEVPIGYLNGEMEMLITFE